MAGRFVDFYALLDVPAGAPVEAVRDAIVAQRLVWEPRQEGGDPAGRAAAADRVRAIDLAEVVLLDPGQRGDYDEEWRVRRRNGHANGARPRARAEPVRTEPARPEPGQPEPGRPEPGRPEPGRPEPGRPEPGRPEPARPESVRPEPVPAEAPPAAVVGDLRLADEPVPIPWRLGDEGDDPPAPDPVRQTPSAVAEWAESWAERGAAAAVAGDRAGAVHGYQQAAFLQPENAAYHFELGRLYSRSGEHARATPPYETAARLAPHVLEYRAALGDALTRSGRPGDAVGVLEQVVAADPTDQRHRAELALALHDACVYEMTALPDGMVCITTAEQARRVEHLTARARALLNPAVDAELATDVHEKHRLAVLAQQWSWRPPVPAWLMSVVVSALGLAVGVLVSWWAGLLTLVLLAGVAFGVGYRPNWSHVARAARAAGGVSPSHAR